MKNNLFEYHDENDQLRVGDLIEYLERFDKDCILVGITENSYGEEVEVELQNLVHANEGYNTEFVKLTRPVNIVCLYLGVTNRIVDAVLPIELVDEGDEPDSEQ